MGSNTVANKVVEMQFDNKDFEKNVEQSMKTLERLEKALDLQNASKAFDDLDKASRKVTFDSLAKNVENIASKFTFLGNIQQTLYKDVISIGKKASTQLIGYITKPYEIAKQKGWARAMNIENAKFQLEGLGIAWSQVEDSISSAVDGTAYGLDSAAKAAGQFAASGVKLGDDMTTALTAISGTAAMANVDYDRMASIFLAAAGKGRVMGDELQRLSQVGINAAAVLGKAMNKTEADVREMASKSQISFKEFAEAMNDAYGEQAKKANNTLEGSLSNIKAALGRIGALFATPIIKEAPELFNAIRVQVNHLKKDFEPLGEIFSDFVVTVGHALSLLVSNEKTTKIIDNVYTSLYNTLFQIINILVPIARAFKNIFPQSLLDTLVKLSNKLLEFTSRLWANEKVLNTIYNVSSGLFSILRVLGDFLKSFITIIGNIVNRCKPLFTLLGDILNILGVLTTQIANTLFSSEKIEQFTKDVIESMDWLLNNLSPIINFILRLVATASTYVIGTISTIVNKLRFLGGTDLKLKFVESIHKAIETLKNVLGSGFDTINEFLSNFEFPTFSEVCEKLKEGFGFVTDGIDGASDIISAAGDKIKFGIENIGTVFEKGKEIFSGFWTYLTSIVNINDIANLGFLILLGKLVMEITSTTKKIGNVMGKLTSTFDNISKLFEDLDKGIRYDNVIKIASAIAILTGSIIALSHIDVKELGKAIGALTIIFLELYIAVAAMNKFADTSEKLAKKKTIENVGKSVKEQVDGVGKAVQGGVNGFFGTIKSTFTGLKEGISKIAESFSQTINQSIRALQKTISLSLTLVSIAGSVLILANAVKTLAEVAKNPKEFENGVTMTVLLLTFVVAASIAISKLTDDLDNAAKFILAMGISVGVLCVSVKMLSSIPWPALVAGLGVVTAIIIALSVAVKKLDKVEISKSTLATLATFVIVVNLLIPIITGLTILAALAGPALAGAVTALAFMLIEFGVALYALSKMKFDPTIIPVMLTFTAALSLLGAEIVAFGAILQIQGGGEVIAAGIGVMVAALLAIGGTLVILGHFGPMMQIAAKAILEANLAFLAGAAGIGVLAVAITMLVTSITLGASAIVASGAVLVKALTILLDAILTAVISLTPKLVLAVGTIMGAIALAIIADKIVIATAIITLIDYILKVLSQHSESIFESIFKIIDDFLIAFDNHASSIAEHLTSTVIKILGGVIAGLIIALPIAIRQIYNAIQKALDEHWDDYVEWSNQVLDDIVEWVTDLGKAILEGIAGIGEGVFEALDASTNGWLGKGVEWAGGLVEGMQSKYREIKEAAFGAGDASLDGIATSIDAHSNSRKTIAYGGFFDGGFAEGIYKGIPEVSDKVVVLGKTALSDLETTVIPEINYVGQDSGEEFADGLANGDTSGGVEDLANKVAGEIEDKAGPKANQSALTVIAEFVTGLTSGSGELSGVGLELGDVLGQGVVDGAAPKIQNLQDLIMSIKNELAVSGGNAKIEKAGYDPNNRASVKAYETQMLKQYEKERKAAEKAAKEQEELNDSLSGSKSGKGSSGGSSKAAKTAKEEVKKLWNTMESGKPVLETIAKKFEKTSDISFRNATVTVSLIQNNLEKSGAIFKDTFNKMLQDTAKSVDGIGDYMSMLGSDDILDFDAFEKLRKSTNEGLELIASDYKQLYDEIVKDFSTKALDNFAEHILITSDKYTDEIKKMDKNSEEYLEAMQAAWEDFTKEIEDAFKMDVFSENERQFSASITDMTKTIKNNQTLVEDYGKTFDRLSLRFAKEKWDPAILKQWALEGYASFDKIAGAFQATRAEMQEMMDSYKRTDELAKGLANTITADLVLSFGEATNLMKSFDDQSVSFGIAMQDMASITEDMSVIIKNRYEEMYEAMKKTLDAQINIFEEYSDSEEEALDPEDLIKYADSQVAHERKLEASWDRLLQKNPSQELVQKLIAMGDEGNKYVDAIGRMTEEQVERYYSKIEEIATIKEEASQRIATRYAVAGEEAINAFVDAIDPNHAVENMDKVVREAVNKGIELAPLAYGPGQKVAESLADGIIKNEKLTNDASKDMGGKIITTLQDSMKEKDLKNIGLYIDKGLASGIDEHSVIVTSAVKKLMSQVKKEAEDAVEEKSPSKWAMRVGRYIDQGLAFGIEDGTKEAVDSIADLGYESISAMEKVIDHIYDIVTGDINIDPTIRPAVDMSDIDAALPYINGVFADRSMQLTRGLGGIRTYNGNYNGESVAQNGNSTTQNITMNVYGAEGQDVDELATIISHKLSREVSRYIG